MNVNGFTRRRGRTAVHGPLGLALLCVGSFVSGPAEGATIKATHKITLSPAEVQVFHHWTKFLSGGTPTWSTTHAPEFTPQIRSTIWQVIKTDTQAQSLANPMIDYLLWRQSLNPRRFATNHPALSPRLSQLLKSVPSLPAGVPPPTFTPVPQTTTTSPQGVTPPLINPSPQGVSPAAIPEPSSFLLALGMTGVGLWWRKRLAGRA
jgi:hypothetical protein